MGIIVVLITLFSVHIASVAGAHAHFNVHYPHLTRAPSPQARPGLGAYDTFCGEIIHNPQRFSGFGETFVSFSGNVGDLVSVRYSRSRVPRKRDDFVHLVASNVPITPSGQLCFNITMPTPAKAPEYGVMLFEAQDPISGMVSTFCSDVKLIDVLLLGKDHPAMCARNNDTLIPMPDEFL